MTLTKKKLKEMVQLERGSELDSLKTAAMFKLERQWQVSIVTLLDARVAGIVLAKKYGVDPSMISRWRKRFGIVLQTNKCLNCHTPFAVAYRQCPYCGVMKP